MLPEVNLSRNISVTIENNTYNISFPTMGQLTKIESLKMLYSTNLYGGLARTGTASATRILDFIDMMAHFNVLIPDLGKDLVGVDSLEDLDPIQAKAYVRAYKTQLMPWLDKWNEIINAPDEKEELEEEPEAQHTSEETE